MSSVTFNLIAAATGALPVLAGAWFHDRLTGFRVFFFWFFFYVVLQESVATFMGLNGRPNVWWSNIYCLTELVFYTAAYQLYLFEKKLIGLYLVTLVAVLAGAVTITYSMYGHNEPNHLVRAFVCICVILYSGFVVLKAAGDVSVSLFRNEMFWFASGTLIFFTMYLIVFAVFPVIVHNNYDRSIHWPVWSVFLSANILSNLLYSFGFLCPKHPLKSPPDKWYMDLARW